MMYLLDTNVCIHYLNGSSPAIREKLQTLHPADIALCSVVKAELLTGARKSRYPEKTLANVRKFLAPFRSLPFDDVAAEIYGVVRADLERRGMPIGPYDLQIASIALAHDLVLVTHNVQEFARITGLRIEDWE